MSDKIHILMIDDDSLMRRLFGAQLVKEGYEVIYAIDGNEGREVARRLQPNLILMDYRLPVMNGLEAASRMKEENETKHIPIIMLTNEDLSLEDQKALKELGVDAYVHKGDDFKTLVESIKKVLGKK